MRKGKLTFKPLPTCCGKPLDNDWPGITCPSCGTTYNADDITEVMLEMSATGKRPTGSVNVRTQ